MNLGIGFWGTPDYFRACGTGNTAPPATFSGTCATQSGNAMMGLVLFNAPYPQYREYLSAQLTCPMQPGITYTLSFWLSNGTGIKSPYTISNIGAHFSAAPLSQTGFNQINVVPQCEITTNIASNSWTQYTFTVIPTAVWNYITFGSFRSDVQNNPVMTYPNPGGPASVYANYFVDEINVYAPSNNSPLQASVSITQPSVCGGTGSATISTTQNNVSYQWLPGNYSTAIVPNLSSGSYSVIISSLSSCNSSSTAINVNIQPNTNLQISLNSLTVCAGQSAVLSPTINGANSQITYSWYPGNTTNPSLTVSPTTTSIYTVNANSPTGCAGTATGTVSVSNVLANFSATVNPCTGSLQLNNTSSGANNYLWNFGDFTSSNSVEPTHSYTAAGVYTISLVSQNNSGCNHTATQTVSVSNPVHSAFDVNINLCDTVAHLTNNSINATSWIWHFGDGTISTLQNPGTHTYFSSGTYSVSLTAITGLGCKDSTVRVITVVKESMADFTFSVTPCSWDVQFVNTSTNAINSLWNFSNNSSSTTTHPLHTFNSSSVYTVTLSINNGSSCQTSVTKTLQIGTGTKADFSYSTGCKGNVKFTNQSNGSTGSIWIFGNNISYLNSPEFTFSSAGNYPVTLISSPGTPCADTITKYVSVSFSPIIANFFYKNEKPEYKAQFQNSSFNAISYFWDFGDGGNSTLFEPNHEYNQPGKYFVCLVAANTNGCKDTLCKTVEIDPDWTFYIPNSFTPNSDNFNDNFYAYATNIYDFKIIVFDHWGEEIFSSDDISNGWDGTFEGKPVQDDMYVWKVWFKDYKHRHHTKTGHVTIIK